MRKGSFAIVVATALVISSVSVMGMARAQIPKVNTIKVECSTPWLKAYVERLLNDRCTCVTPSTFAADTTLEIKYADVPGTIVPLSNVTVTATLLRDKRVLWHASRDWLAGTPGMGPRNAALGLVTGFILHLDQSVRLGSTRHTTRLFLQQASKIAIVPADDWDRALASTWVTALNRAGCKQVGTQKQDADALLEHVQVSSLQVNHISDIEVECTSDSHGTYCSDNLGGSLSVECVSSYCSASSTTGDPNDARPDLRIITPRFAWIFIDPKTGQRIGNWSTRLDSIRKIKHVLGCK